MRVAIFSDIHGNLVALEAVLADIAQEGIDQMVCLGDVAATGPQPVETIVRLRQLHCPVVMGNTDDQYLALQPLAAAVQDLVSAGLKEEEARRVAEIYAWSAEKLSADDVDFLRSFQPTLEMPLSESQTLLCFHGSPGSYRDVIRADSPEAELERMFAGYRATVMAGGHTHTQMLRRYRDSILINPGSVGLPVDRDPHSGQLYNPPWAEYALVDWVNGRLGIDLRRVPVDVEAVIRAALESGMPHAQWWAGDWRRS